MSSSFVRRGGGWVLAQGLLMLAAIVLAPVFRWSWPRMWGLVPGLAMICTGGFLGIAGALVLGANRTPFPRPRQNSQLIRHGIYSRVRHPLYGSVMLSALGWALVWRSWPALLAALALIPFFHAKARAEERWLCEKFADYPNYAKSVPRFMPRLRHGRLLP